MKYTVFLVLFAVPIWLGCSKESNINNQSEATNIVLTDSSGNVLEDNSPDDWQPRLNPNDPFVNIFSIKPPYPNPSQSEINFHFAVSENGTLNIGVYKDDVLLRLLHNQEVGMGQYIVVWDLSDTGGNKVTAGFYNAKFVFIANSGSTLEGSGTVKVD